MKIIKFIIVLVIPFLAQIFSKQSFLSAESIAEQFVNDNTLKINNAYEISNDPTFILPRRPAYPSYPINQTNIMSHVNNLKQVQNQSKVEYRKDPTIQQREDNAYYNPIVPSSKIISLPGIPTQTVYADTSEYFPSEENIKKLEVKYSFVKAAIDKMKDAYYDPSHDALISRADDLKNKIEKMKKDLEESKQSEPKEVKSKKYYEQTMYPVGYNLSPEEIQRAMDKNVLESAN